jgi:Ras homolog gene family, member G
LVATKLDLRGNEEFEKKLEDEKRGPMITKQEGEAKAAEIKSQAFFECSAMENQGVQEIFEKIVELYFTTKKSGGCTLL